MAFSEIKCAFKREGGKKGNVTTEAKWYRNGSEDGGKNHDPRITRNTTVEAVKGQEPDCPIEFSEAVWPCPHLVANLVKLIRTSDLQNCRTINSCGLKPRELPWWLSGKETSCSAGDDGDMGSIPGSGRSPGVGYSNPLQYPYLENPMDRGAWQASIYRVKKSWTQLSDLHFQVTYLVLYVYACVSLCFTLKW